MLRFNNRLSIHYCQTSVIWKEVGRFTVEAEAEESEIALRKTVLRQWHLTSHNDVLGGHSPSGRR